MQKICDVYLSEATRSGELKFISLFDKNFVYSADATYAGYMNVNIGRIKLVPVVSELRKHGVRCFSVPVEYRNHEGITGDQALHLASEHAMSLGRSIAAGRSRRSGDQIPLVWTFWLTAGLQEEEKAGGCVMIDRLDGHVWTGAEYEEYMYDYNNIL